MSEDDTALARRALKRYRLSGGQVEQLPGEAARTGTSFLDLAVGRSLLSTARVRASDVEQTVPPNPKRAPERESRVGAPRGPSAQVPK